MGLIKFKVELTFDEVIMMLPLLRELKTGNGVKLSSTRLQLFWKLKDLRDNGLERLSRLKQKEFGEKLGIKLTHHFDNDGDFILNLDDGDIKSTYWVADGNVNSQKDYEAKFLDAVKYREKKIEEAISRHQEKINQLMSCLS